jgi:hypothetical protein
MTRHYLHAQDRRGPQFATPADSTPNVWIGVVSIAERQFFFAASTAFSADAFAAAESLLASLAASLASLAALFAAAASAGAGVTTVVDGGGVTTAGDAAGAAGVTTTGVVAGRLSHAASANAAKAMQRDVLFMIVSFTKEIALA